MTNVETTTFLLTVTLGMGTVTKNTIMRFKINETYNAEKDQIQVNFEGVYFVFAGCLIC